MSNDPTNWIPRAQVLTQKDLEELAKLLQQHPCKFSVSHEEMDDIKRMSNFLKRFETKVLDSITWALLALIAGFFWLMYNHGYFMKGK